MYAVIFIYEIGDNFRVILDIRRQATEKTTYLFPIGKALSILMHGEKIRCTQKQKQKEQTNGTNDTSARFVRLNNRMK
jgi:hypothetical protein